MFFGDRSAPRGKPIRELLHTQLVVDDLRNNVLVHPIRDLNYRFMVAEWLWIEAGREDVRTVAEYNKQIAQFSDDGEIFNGAYGPRMEKQWLWLIDLVKRDRDTRQGIVSIWSPAPADSKDIPCTLSLQILQRGNKLHGIVTMRSQDLWLGLPYDFFNFSQIVNGLAGELQVPTGSLTFNVGSSHVYETNWAQVEAVLEAESHGYHVRSPQLPRRPPANDLLNGKEMVFEEDELYQRVLQSKGKKQALSILREGV
jgi:thymidylate synthase